MAKELQFKGDNPDTLAGGFVRALHGTRDMTVQVPRAEELARVNASVDTRLARLDRKKRSTKLSIMGISKAILDKGDPKYVRCLTMANRYRKVRARELAELHGHVSSGASALLASGSLALAASRFLYERYAEDGGGDLGVTMLKQAAQLADSARQSELAAWEMSAREGMVKRRLEASTAGMPWLTVHDDGRNKMGRKTNLERKEIDAITVDAVPPTDTGIAGLASGASDRLYSGHG